MKVALFGRTGFIGGHIADILLQRHIPFVGISRSRSSSDTIAVDWTSAQSLNKIPADVTTAIICSSKLPQKTYLANDISEFMTSNVLGVVNILEWAKHTNVSRIVYCSTLSMLPDENAGSEVIDIRSHYPYKVSKAAAEHILAGYCRENSIEYIILRIASVYGPGMKADVIHTMFRAAKSGGVFTLNDRSAGADFVHVDDVALAAVESLSVYPANLIMNVASGEPVKLIDLWKIIKEDLGIQQASIDVKGDSGARLRVNTATDFKKLIKRPLLDLQTGIHDLIKTYR